MSSEKKRIDQPEIVANLIPYENLTYRKSNFLISAKYKSPLLENKILALSMMRIEEDDKGNLRSELTVSELKRYMRTNKRSGSFYDQLKSCAAGMASRQISMEDRENQRFKIINVVQTAEYSNGVFSVKYNTDMKKYLYNIQKNFTILNIDILVSFENVYTFRLYELLKSKAYYPKNVNRTDNCFNISYLLSELKLDLGVVNSNLDRVQKNLIGKTPDFDKAVEQAQEKTYDRWFDFRSRVLDIAVNEINSKPETEMYIEYAVAKKGKGGKVYEVYFTVQLRPQEPTNDLIVDIDDPEGPFDILDAIDNLLADERVRLKDIKAIAKAADDDIQKVEHAYEVYQKQNTEADNFVGWMINAIKNEYTAPAKKKNEFNKFEQNDYDYDELEKQILAN